MIAVINYQLGNLGSVVNAFQYLGIPVQLTADPREIKKAAGLVLPGVGAFGKGMENLRKNRLDQLIKAEVSRGKPLLGICLGQQLLFEGSEEAAGIDGLGLLRGWVKKFSSREVGKVPHIGWNRVEAVRTDQLLNGLSDNYFYFVHSYYVLPENKEDILGETSYGKRIFASVVSRGQIWGLQCHPEKSGRIGLSLLKNFGEVVNDGGNSGD